MVRSVSMRTRRRRATREGYGFDRRRLGKKCARGIG
jgi:hypothetical protein